MREATVAYLADSLAKALKAQESSSRHTFVSQVIGGTITLDGTFDIESCVRALLQAQKDALTEVEIIYRLLGGAHFFRCAQAPGLNAACADFDAAARAVPMQLGTLLGGEWSFVTSLDRVVKGRRLAAYRVVRECSTHA